MIDSVYTSLVSQAVDTKIITTANPDDDPVQYVPSNSPLLGHEPDAAAHFYWSDKLCSAAKMPRASATTRRAHGLLATVRRLIFPSRER